MERLTWVMQGRHKNFWIFQRGGGWHSQCVKQRVLIRIVMSTSSPCSLITRAVDENTFINNKFETNGYFNNE